MIIFNDSSSSDMTPEEEKKTEEKLAETTLNLLKNASVSSLIYGYLKSKDIKLSDMSVADFKQIENDIIKILVTEINLDEAVGLQMDKDNMSFTALANTIRFFFSLFTLEEENEEGEEEEEGEKNDSSSSSTFFFEDI